MIISRSPLRMSFVGGGSDIASYYTQFGGAVVSVTMDKYVFITVNKKFDNFLRVSYSDTENVSHSSEIKHGIIRAALTMLNIEGGLEITTIADIPSSGTGLGSSSSFTVGLLQALYAYQSRFASSEKLARESCHIEIDICGSPIGKQDQYAAAYGGMNLIRFHKDGSVDVNPVICSPENMLKLEKNLLLFYTGRTRSANSILKEQSKNSADSQAVQETLGKMVSQTTDFALALQKGECDKIGEIMDEGWHLKRKLASGISDGQIDEWYENAKKAGAIGGKILGAGAGGFFLFYAPQQYHEAIIYSLPHLKRVPFRFERTGANIIFYRP